MQPLETLARQDTWRRQALAAGDLDLSGGVVAAVPAQSIIIFTVVGDRETAVEQVRTFAENMHRGIHHPLGSEPFSWRDGVLTLAGADDDLLETLYRLSDALALDRMPDAITTFHDEHVDHHGLDHLREAALHTVPVEGNEQQAGCTCCWAVRTWRPPH